MNKKLIIVEVVTVFIALVAAGVYYSPKFFNKQEVMMAAKIKSDNNAFTTKALEEFATNNDIKASEVAKKISDELNEKGRNPYSRKKPLYTFETECKACSSVEYDDSAEMIILTTYNRRGDLVARTVIKPPSFVTYLKNEDKKLH